MAMGITAAWAPGSISLDEVMDKLKDNAKLVDEINAELKAQNLSADTSRACQSYGSSRKAE